MRELELENICGIFQQVAAVTFETNELFLPYEYLSSGQTAGVDAGHESGITGFITVPDVKAQPLQRRSARWNCRVRRRDKGRA